MMPYNLYSNLEILFIGFGLTSLLILILFFFKETKEFSLKFHYTSTYIIKYIGLIYLLLYVISTVNFLSSEGHILHVERAQGPYAWAYWLMILRPLVLFLLTQLFWIKKIRKIRWYSIILSLVILLVATLSGQNIERYIIFITSLHRDYQPYNSNIDDTLILFVVTLIYEIIKSIVFFSSCVFITLAFLRKKETK
jgi:hypothetical protein